MTAVCDHMDGCAAWCPMYAAREVEVLDQLDALGIRFGSSRDDLPHYPRQRDVDNAYAAAGCILMSISAVIVVAVLLVIAKVVWP